MQTVFTSKANVLKFLSRNLKRSTIEDIYDFTVSQWSDSKGQILRQIREVFDGKPVIVRSSAIGEDSVEKSDAGNYDSVLNVPSLSEKKLLSAINAVIYSYWKKSNWNQYNQVLVQKHTQNVATSGVLFTRTENIGAPYYTINYEDGPATDNVTKGKINNTVKIFRGIAPSMIPAKWKPLLESVKEIESTLRSDLLDIEFAISRSGHVVIFQVRPLTCIKRDSVPDLEKKIRRSIVQSQRLFSRRVKRNHLFGDYTVFSDMADWNPAEIIGNNPNRLDYTLYNYLIMRSAWHVARKRLGYHDVSPHGLMVRFGSKPYVDTRASFNSLLADNIPAGIKDKLLNFFLDKMRENPHLHDKVEFDILFTCYDAGLSQRLREVPTLTSAEQEIVETQLREFTNRIIKDFPRISRECEQSANLLAQNRTLALAGLNGSRNDHRALIRAAHRLLNDCVSWGTIPFAIMARLAFISCILLRSLAEAGKIPAAAIDAIMGSVRTPLSEFQEACTALLKKQLSAQEFFQKYGHLRPGTYDITALRYDKRKQLFEDLQIQLPHREPLEESSKTLRSLSLKDFGLDCETKPFLDFVRESIRQREELKFLFSKSLSDALELLSDAGSILGLSRQEMSQLSVNTIFGSYNKLEFSELQAAWRNQANEEKERQMVNRHLVLPSVIKSAIDFEVISYFKALPNFITQKSLVKAVVHLSGAEEAPELGGRIILLENADPGYDWIFTRNPAGLITKYGGVASHMAIRCGELGLPAAIGCGEIIYQKLLHSEKVLLDCKNRQIISLETRRPDKFMEQKRMLKLLGYIK
jgi:hypothetical protein